MVVSVSGDDARFLTETEDFPVDPTPAEALEFLKAVEDDSSWEGDCTPEEIFVDGVDIIAETEANFD